MPGHRMPQDHRARTCDKRRAQDGPGINVCDRMLGANGRDVRASDFVHSIDEKRDEVFPIGKADECMKGAGAGPTVRQQPFRELQRTAGGNEAKVVNGNRVQRVSRCRCHGACLVGSSRFSVGSFAPARTARRSLACDAVFPRGLPPGCGESRSAHPKGRRWQGALLSAERENETMEAGQANQAPVTQDPKLQTHGRPAEHSRSAIGLAMSVSMQAIRALKDTAMRPIRDQPPRYDVPARYVLPKDAAPRRSCGEAFATAGAFQAQRTFPPGGTPMRKMRRVKGLPTEQGADFARLRGARQQRGAPGAKPASCELLTVNESPSYASVSFANVCHQFVCKWYDFDELAHVGRPLRQERNDVVRELPAWRLAEGPHIESALSIPTPQFLLASYSPRQSSQPGFIQEQGTGCSQAEHPYGQDAARPIAPSSEATPRKRPPRVGPQAMPLARHTAR